MSRVPLYWVDAFADAVGEGNPAAVCPLEDWLPDDVLRAVAAENGLSETAFVLTDRDPMDLRWFAPAGEVELCGHATLAAAFVVLTLLEPQREDVTFATRAGDLTVSRQGDGFTLELPVLSMRREKTVPRHLAAGLGAEPSGVWSTADDPNYVAIFGSEEDVRALEPDLSRLERLHPCGVAVSAPGESVDYVCRYFAPGYGIPEDPVTGSIQCSLGPYWAHRLDRSDLAAAQLSRRGGRLDIQVAGDRVRITGRVTCYMTGAICCLPRV